MTVIHPALPTHHEPVQLAVVAAVEVVVGGRLSLRHALHALMASNT